MQQFNYNSDRLIRIRGSSSSITFGMLNMFVVLFFPFLRGQYVCDWTAASGRKNFARSASASSHAQDRIRLVTYCMPIARYTSGVLRNTMISETNSLSVRKKRATAKAQTLLTGNKEHGKLLFLHISFCMQDLIKEHSRFVTVQKYRAKASSDASAILRAVWRRFTSRTWQAIERNTAESASKRRQNT